MPKAMWNGQLLAESETTETVEGNIYFPEESVNRDAAWYYPDPKPAARNVKHHIAFWRGVEVTK